MYDFKSREKDYRRKNLGFLGYPDYSVDTHGHVYNDLKKFRVQSTRDPRGYLYVTIRNKSNKFVKVRVHVLVSSAFVGIRTKELSIIDHKSGNKEHNHYTNLELVSHQENVIRAYKKCLNSRKKDCVKND